MDQKPQEQQDIDIEKKILSNENKLFSKFTISDGVIIALLTIASYLVIFLFNMGYFGYFKLPIDLISFDLSEMIGTTLPVLLIIFLIFYLLKLPFDIC